MKLMKTLMIAGALVVSAQAAHASDVAKDVSGRLSTIVKYEDLDLNRAADATALHNRLWIAAKKVCVVAKVSDLKGRRIFDECRAHAMSEAVADVNNPNLNQTYLARKGKQAPTLSVASLR